MKRKLKVLAVGAALAILPALPAPASATCYAHEYDNVETEQRCIGLCAQNGCGSYEYFFSVCQCYPSGWPTNPGGDSAQFMTPASLAEAPAASNPASR